MINPHEIIKSIFSSEGFSNELFSVKFDKTISVKIDQDKDGNFQVSFLDSEPTIKVRRYITLSLKISGILLKPNGGVFQIDYFPDIPFKYNWLFEQDSEEEISE